MKSMINILKAAFAFVTAFGIAILTGNNLVNGGTITFPPSGYNSFNNAKHKRFADDPLLTNTLYLTPNHFDQAFSNSLTFGPAVSLGSFSINNSITGLRSSCNKLFFIKGNFMRIWFNQ